MQNFQISQLSDEKDLFLAIESSCDDSSVAIISRKDLHCEFYETLTQAEHCAAGGVVPELASRLHTAALPDILARARPFFSRLCAVGATTEPGLSVSLQSGVACAKALCAALGLPFVSVNHLAGHICSPFLESPLPERFLCLLVSGGHTQILRVEHGCVELLAATSDDSLGESFDKSAKMLGGPYPGGAWVSARASEWAQLLASGGEKAAEIAARREFDFKFSVPLRREKTRLEYSFSGLKNQVRLKAQNAAPQGLEALYVQKICYEFERAAVAHITDKLTPFLDGFSKLVVVGGASANAHLRANLSQLCAQKNIQLLLAPLKFCSDNARMIARAGMIKLLRGEFCELNKAVISARSKDFFRI